MTGLTWLSGADDILGAPYVRDHAALATFCRLMLRARPLRGALTLVLDGYAIQFGRPSDAVGATLTAVHRSEPAERPPDSDGACTAVQCGFDLADEQLGLTVDRNRRHAWPADVDRQAGAWVDPVVRVHSADLFTRILVQRNLGLAEGFLAGEFEMLRGSVHHFIAMVLINDVDRQIHLPTGQQLALFRQYLQWRWRRSHNEDIAEHYDIGDNIMVPMLGATGCYSCGYMSAEDDDLDAMQVRKMNLIFSKLRLEPDMRILDTGCGNGGALVHAALSWGCHGEGFTNSYNMASLARRNAEANGVSDRVTIHHADFSLLSSYPDDHFDAIYEIGVWEHLRFGDYHEVMRQCERILKPNGRMLIHSMGSHQARHRRDGFIQKYIFKDSNQIRLHLLTDEARRNDMYVADVENLGRHYYWTLWYWRKNLLEAYEQDQSIRERDFLVMLYFLECGMAESRFGDGIVYHLLLFKNPRDYRQTWRVDGRIHDPGRGAIEDRPFLMKPSDANVHLHNDAATEGKLEADVYRRPGIRKRLSQILDTLRSVTNQ